MSIEVKNVNKLYGSQKALDHVSFSVNTGEVVGFLGPNGAGKSTLMKIITCYIPQSSGRVNVCGFDVETQSIDVRKNVGYLPENNPLYYDMYVKEYLEFIAGIHNVLQIKQRVAEMIETIGLSVEQKKKIGQLSKGYKQRVGLAQALLHNPQVLILDEPTTGLDPNQLAEIRALIKRIGATKTIMLSTHIMQEVEAICDRVIIINNGKIVADAKASDLKKIASNKEIITIEFAENVEAKQLQKVKGVLRVALLASNTWEIEGDGQHDVRNNLFRFAVENNLSVLTLRKETQSIEEVFKELTKQ
ncbi:MAG: gliding motility-associated ABC transporter ATP-binding subunit GldA [Bacteroidetes bacterium]|nr:gliding motility-associated ABC transporter ATP-binding subunit GldA [Bacteroidota bacterium]NOG94840.1 gliding motility-associated ABC transporter ATP-binding subunit GldA [Bacteroidota bacterium]GIK69309.1 MAG: gliding motility-associated ABC transporter ATP-binding subunit GldA [Bacteroidota bacterium]CAG0962067.1 Linearmycin resistance ATP-binding protein LnrL [Flavobacteriales bacterium]